MSLWLILVSAAASMALAAALWNRSRDRRQIATLLARIERLEAAWQELGPDPDPVAAGATTPVDPDLVAAALVQNPSGDVLAGRTSHVRRLLDGSGLPPRSLADQALLAVHRRIADNLTPVELAAELCVSLRTLERGLAQTLECTPRQLILTAKMREARLLLQQGHRVADVAQQLGFVNVFHFSRRFKGLYHVAPSQIPRLLSLIVLTACALSAGLSRAAGAATASADGRNDPRATSPLPEHPRPDFERRSG